ncbi:methyltransferase domain-containing protein [Bradyrhizobium sp. BRP22]|uniref:SAM-dependent methyltransferase n=1 Tax=Bradyrhizobium sp. BRP22 TaxID=2793821 RepID=UPI001CD6024D|nr:class I SAM-dependent methyltransferase [Bradyrhizobium sp. BRP22]MCA1454615.1 methyltransferase domain-containing protein [Bradyrhizobium sp. BRP22]
MRELQKRIEMRAAARTAQVTSYELDEWESEVMPPDRKVTSVLELTEYMLQRSGIVRGMRVLDLGCGTGEASFWIAKLVGPSGLVVGVDQSAEAIDLAERRATLAGQCYWTRFVVADPSSFVSHEPFDAVVARLTSLRRRKGVATSSRLFSFVRPGGVVVLVSGNPSPVR